MYFYNNKKKLNRLCSVHNVMILNSIHKHTKNANIKTLQLLS